MATLSSRPEIRFYRSRGPYAFLSNLHRCEVRFEEKVFRSSEDAYQYRKPKDIMVAEWLISAPTPRLCAMAAHGLFIYDVKPGWNETKVERMRAVLRAKFSQHANLAASLKGTGATILIEDSKTDAFWGIGKRKNGKNMLGILLMELRNGL